MVLTAVALWVALGALRRAVRDERDAAMIGLAVAAHPLFLINGARVANDALGVALATAAVASCLAIVLDRDPRRPIVRWFATGLLIGLAILAKATNFSLVPFAASCWVAATVRNRTRMGRAVCTGLALAAGCLLVVQADLRHNLEHFGVITPMQEAVINHANGRTGADLFRTAATIDWFNTSRRLWESGVFYVGGWSALWTRATAVAAYGIALKVGLLGWAWWAAIGRRRGGSVFISGWVPSACVVLVASYTLALGYHMVQSKLAWGASSTGPWYACPALPWFLTLAVAGGLCWPLGRWLRPAVPVALAGAGVSAEVFGIFGPMVRTYSGGAWGWESLRRLALVQDPLLGTTTLALALVAEVLVLAALVLVWRDSARVVDFRCGPPSPPRAEFPPTSAGSAAGTPGCLKGRPRRVRSREGEARGWVGRS